MKDRIMRFFKSRNSRSIAKERLKFILIQDRSLLSPSLLREMKEEILNVINQYLEINKNHIELSIGRKNKKTVLEATIPVKGVKKRNK